MSIQKTAPNPKEFDLKTTFAKDLKEIAANTQSMTSYVDTLLGFVQEEFESKQSHDFKTLARLFGEAGNYLRVLGRLDEAEDALFTALDIEEEHELGVQTFVQMSIRLGDVKRYQKDWEDAQELLETAVDISRENPDAQQYLDFGLQHLGKLFYDLLQFEDALDCFDEALEIRQAKGDKALIESTEFAIERTVAAYEGRP